MLTTMLLACCAGPNAVRNFYRLHNVVEIQGATLRRQGVHIILVGKPFGKRPLGIPERDGKIRLRKVVVE
jgi:hypothetical protein